ncbi:LysR substrate-binding domain-containing protein [Nocardia sp. NBC_00416]|uniref:LysR substrate-binding domain-containing protein n=1 Tax=Nocardia sp. NBC_00416 TaxID=2975991 RepID=UPI002E201D59
MEGEDRAKDIDEILEHGVHSLLPELAVFVGLADWSTLTDAADEVGIGQPTASRMLARLQRELGLELVRRVGRNIVLTPIGAIFLPFARRCLEELQHGILEAHEEHARSRGTVTLSFLHTLGARFVPELIEEFRTEFPGVDFVLMQDNRENCLRSLSRREVDLAFVSPAPTEAMYISKIIQRQELLLTVPTDHWAATRSSIDLSEVRREDFVVFTAGVGLRSLADALCRQAGFTPRARFHVQDTMTARGIVAAGLGVAVLPHSDQPVAVGRGCREIAISGARAERQLAVTWLTESRITKASDAFRRFALGKFGVVIDRDDTVTEKEWENPL